MRDGCIWLWSVVREWWWAVPVVMVWGIVLCAARIQVVMLSATMRCNEWLADCLNEYEEEQGD